MPNHCTVTIMGHLGQDPELRQTKGGNAVCNASIAYTPYGEGKQTVWFTLTVWGKQAERFTQWFRKGDAVLAVGELDQETWTSKDGEERNKLVIKVSSFSGTGKAKENGDSAPAPAKRPAKAAKPAQDDDASGEVPF